MPTRPPQIVAFLFKTQNSTFKIQHFPQMETLIGQHILLRPLLASDAMELVQAASDGELWNLPYTVVPSEATIQSYIQTALEGRGNGTVMPFVTAHKSSNRAIGSTRFMKIDRKNRVVEIGGTWLAASWQKTFANAEAKLLMLQYAFEALHCVRVQFCTDEHNHQSREAILRLGAKQEGILRNERIMANGRKRNSVFFSILDDEWDGVRKNLERRLSAYV